MSTAIKSEPTRSVVEVNGIQCVAFNQDGTMQQLTAAPIGADNFATFGNKIQRFSSVPVAAGGTSVEFTGIPSWAKRLTLTLVGVSSNGTSNFQLQVGTDASWVTANYFSVAETNNTSTLSSTGFVIDRARGAATNNSGSVVLMNVNSNTWTSSGLVALSELQRMCTSSGHIYAGGRVTRLRLTTVSGTDTFDAGEVNLFWE